MTPIERDRERRLSAADLLLESQSDDPDVGIFPADPEHLFADADSVEQRNAVAGRAITPGDLNTDPIPFRWAAVMLRAVRETGADLRLAAEALERGSLYSDPDDFLPEPHFDRFDIVEAHYVFLSHYHEGGGSESYRRLSTMETRLRFRPRPDLSLDTLSENGRAIYARLVARHAAAARRP